MIKVHRIDDSLEAARAEAREDFIRRIAERTDRAASADAVIALAPKDWAPGENDADAFLKAAKEVWGPESADQP